MKLTFDDSSSCRAAAAEYNERQHRIKVAWYRDNGFHMEARLAEEKYAKKLAKMERQRAY
jgi:hypothetical protein